MIKISGISKSYTTGFFIKKPNLVLNNISLKIRNNEIFGIIGLNGAGKSTLLKIIMGFVKPDTGSTTIKNIDSDDCSCHQYIGFLPENPSLYPLLTPIDHLNFALSLQNKKSIKFQKGLIETTLKQVDLSHVATTPIKKFSKGMRQRTALAYALITQPEILILDEPMSGLDPLGRHLVVDIMKTFHQKGTTIVFCSHILSDVERICDRIGILHKGHLVSVIEANSICDKRIVPPLSGQTPLENFFLSQIQSI